MLKYKHHADTKHLLQNCQLLYPAQFSKLQHRAQFQGGLDPIAILGAIGMAIWCSEIEPELLSSRVDSTDMFAHVKEDIQIALAVLGTKFKFPEEQTE